VKGTDRAHKIPHGNIANGTLGPVLEFTILRFGLAMERDDAPQLWADKVNRLGAYWLPTSNHTGEEQAREFAASIEGFPVRLAALDREASGGRPEPTLAQCRAFFLTFKALRPDLKLGIYGTRFTCRDLAADFDWTWMASEPFPGQRFDMRQRVIDGVDQDEWVRDEDFDDFFGGDGVSVKDLEQWSGLKAETATGVFLFIAGELQFAQGGPRPHAVGPKQAGFDFAKKVATVAAPAPVRPGRTTQTRPEGPAVASEGMTGDGAATAATAASTTSVVGMAVRGGPVRRGRATTSSTKARRSRKA
jgi:hypothetical protein